MKKIFLIFVLCLSVNLFPQDSLSFYNKSWINEYHDEIYRILDSMFISYANETYSDKKQLRKIRRKGLNYIKDTAAKYATDMMIDYTHVVSNKYKEQNYKLKKDTNFYLRNSFIILHDDYEIQNYFKTGQTEYFSIVKNIE